jgi:hypothetical protein
MIAGLIARFVAPYLLQILIGVAIAGGVTGIYFKIKHDAVAAERAKVEKEKQDAIDIARKAKDHIRARCDVDPANCVSDGWFRD